MGFRVDGKDWLWCAGLVLLGVAGIAGSQYLAPTIALQLPQAIAIPLLTAIAIGVCAAIGAGIGAPLKKKTIGAFVGATAVIVFLLLTKLPGR